MLRVIIMISRLSLTNTCLHDVQPFDALQAAELLWVDRLGLYVFVKPLGEMGSAIRMPFVRPVRDERDARSMLTLMAQQSWELERKYTPVMPSLLEPSLAG